MTIDFCPSVIPTRKCISIWAWELTGAAKHLLRRGACLFERAEPIGKPRNIDNDVV